MSAWAIVVPQAVAVTNLVTNPSGELATTGYTGITNTVTRTASQQRRGAWSLSYPMASGVNDGLYFGTVSLTNGVTYTFSVDVRGVAGVSYRIYYGSTGGAVLGTPTTFVGTGRWQRVSVTYAETSTTTRRLYITKNNSSNTGTIYVDGLLCIASAVDLLYFDGDARGFRDGDFYWTGTPHASTSVMRAGTRAGGQAVDMNTYGFYVRQALGLGLAALLNVGPATPLIGGGQYQRTIVQPRSFALAGFIHGDTRQELQRSRRDLINAVKPDATPAQQPLLLRYQAVEDGTVYGEPVDIPAVFEGGLEGGELIGPAENVALKFVTYMPFVAVEDGHEGANLTYQTTVTSPGILQQDMGTGAFSAVGTGAASPYSVYALANGLDGGLYAGGSFTQMGGVANTAYIAKWINGAWQALGTGMNGQVLALVVGPDGSLYAGGSFTLAGGVANTAYIARWNGSAWVALGTGMNGQVNALAIGPDGSLYAGGSFTLAGGVANTSRIARWTGSVWQALGTGTNLAVNSMAVGLDGMLYVGGVFSSAGGVANTAYIARWNGVAWFPVGSGGADAAISYVGRTKEGNIFVSGTGLTTIGGLALVYPSAIWTGSTWTGSQNGSVTNAILFSPAQDKTFYGNGASGVVGVIASNQVANSGTSQAFPVIRFSGYAQLYVLKNFTTGDALYFNLTLQPGEVAHLDLTPGAIRFYSNVRPNLLNTILPGSDLATFRLVPGINYAGLLIPNFDGNAAAWAYWRKPHWSIDGGAN